MNALTKAAWEFKREFAAAVLKEELAIKKVGARKRAANRLGVHRNVMSYLFNKTYLKGLTDERDPQPTAQEVRALQRGAESGVTKMSRLRKPNESVSNEGASPQEVRLPLCLRPRKVRFTL
jgi:hypothetical protein